MRPEPIVIYNPMDHPLKPMNTAMVQTPRPPTGTQEWAASNVNIQDGCEHDCRYCYAKTMAIRFKRATPASWRFPRLRQHDLDRGYTRRAGRIMRSRWQRSPRVWPIRARIVLWPTPTSWWR